MILWICIAIEEDRIDPSTQREGYGLVANKILIYTYLDIGGNGKYPKNPLVSMLI